MARVVVVGGVAESLVNFRGDLIAAMVRQGHEVLAMAADTSDDTRSRIEALGCRFVPYRLQRTGRSVTEDLATMSALRTAFSRSRPDVILAYTIKPVIWGGLALQTLSQRPRFFALVTGLGYAFAGAGLRRKSLTALVTALYRRALARAEGVFFQNGDDRDAFVRRRIVRPEQCEVVGGSGVNLRRFPLAPLPVEDGSPIVFLCIARLLADKGLREYAEAAAAVTATANCRCELAGPEDSSPDAIPMTEVRSWEAAGSLRYLGAVPDVRPLLAKCHVYVLPSYHEGMPRTVLEAMAAGRPILTTRVPGCRDTVVEGQNGRLVPPRDAGALAEAMRGFVRHPEALPAMSLRSRQLAEEKFDVDRVNETMLRRMGLRPQRPAS